MHVVGSDLKGNDHIKIQPEQKDWNLQTTKFQDKATIEIAIGLKVAISKPLQPAYLSQCLLNSNCGSGYGSATALLQILKVSSLWLTN